MKYFQSLKFEATQIENFTKITSKEKKTLEKSINYVNNELTKINFLICQYKAIDDSKLQQKLNIMSGIFKKIDAIDEAQKDPLKFYKSYKKTIYEDWFLTVSEEINRLNLNLHEAAQDILIQDLCLQLKYLSCKNSLSKIQIFKFGAFDYNMNNFLSAQINLINDNKDNLEEISKISENLERLSNKIFNDQEIKNTIWHIESLKTESYRVNLNKHNFFYREKTFSYLGYHYRESDYFQIKPLKMKNAIVNVPVELRSEIFNRELEDYDADESIRNARRVLIDAEYECHMLMTP